jgi:hypothetical protein
LWVKFLVSSLCFRVGQLVPLYRSATKPSLTWDLLNWFKIGLIYALVTAGMYTLNTVDP